MIEQKETNQGGDAKDQIRSMLDLEKKDKQKEATGNGSKGKLPKAENRVQLRYLIIGAILLILSIGLFYLAFITKTDIEQAHNQQLKAMANKELNKLVGQASKEISNKTQSFITELNNIKAIPFDSPAQLESLKKRLESSLKNSQSVQIISADYTDDEIIDDPQMGYTFLFLLKELKRVKSTSADNFTMIELYKGDTTGKKLLLMHKLMNKDVTIAYIIARLSMEFIDNLVTQFDAKGSYFEIIQQHSSIPFVLVKKGNASLKALPIMISKNLKNTPWKIKYWGAQQKKELAIEQYYQALIYLAFSLIIIIIAGILFVLAFTSKKRRMQHQPVRVTEQKEKEKKKESEKSKESQSFLNTLKTNTVEDTTKAANAPGTRQTIANNIFGEYDVLGAGGDFVNADTLAQIARLIAKEVKAKQQDKIVIARDGRNSSQQLSEAVIDSIVNEGVEVIDIGMVSTPMLYYAALYKADGNGLMVTGSHNPANYNGMKIMLGGHHYAGADLRSLKQAFILGHIDGDEDNETAASSQLNIINEYIDNLCHNISLSRPMNVVIDAANGVMGPLSVQLFKRLNCDVTLLNETVDGNFPGHLPDPSRPENMTDLAHKVVELKADIGFAFDGDGSRLGVVSSDGQIIWPDRILMLLGKDILTRNNAASVLYDVKSSKKINGFIHELGGKAIMCRCGHSFMANKLQETGALIAGEMSGHIFIKDRWFGFDDAAYAAARILEILSLNQQKSAPIFSQLPQSINTPEILIQTKDVSKIINTLCNDKENFTGGEIIIIDGIRVEYEDGWGIVRASHTTNKLSIRFEADNEEALQRIANTFKASIINASPEIVLPF